MIQLVYTSWWGERKLYTLNGVRTASRATFVRLTLLNNGWLIRYIHANGASMFFIIVYLHIARGLYYGSYMAPRELL